MVKCDFSKEEIEPGTGKKVILKDGTILNFKNSKCEKNFFMGRKPRTTKWTKEYHMIKEGKKA